MDKADAVMMRFEMRVRVTCEGSDLGIMCTEKAETWADARLDRQTDVVTMEVPTVPEGWTRARLAFHAFLCPRHKETR